LSIELYASFVLASIALVIIPGPSVTVIISNAGTGGTGAGLKTVLGNTLGLAVLLFALILGLAPIMELIAEWFDWFRIAGAAYLVWLGFTRFRYAGRSFNTSQTAQHSSSFILQGLITGLSNPKTLLFFGVFLPQFIDPTGNVSSQLALLAVTFLVIAAALDSGFAVLAGRAKTWMSGAGAKRFDQAGGLVLMGGGIWLALTRR